MKTIVKNIYNAEKQHKAFEKGWSFSGQNIAGKDNRILFI